jgi:large subunit ribosomal protein L16
MTISKFRRKFKVKKKINTKSNFLGLCKLGIYGIKALCSAWITVNQIECSRRVIIRHSNRVGKIFIRVVFHYPLTSKPSGCRMGKGSGHFKKWVAFIKKGSVFIEISGITEIIAKEAFKAITYQFPIKICFVSRDLI